MSGWFGRRSLYVRVSICAVLAVSAFLVSAAAGALVAGALEGDLGWPGWREPPPVGASQEDTTPQEESGSDSQYAVPETVDLGGEGGASTETRLWEALQGCKKSKEDCARDFVAEVAPRATYAGDTIDSDSSGRTRHVLYFMDPERPPCKYRMFESSAEGPDQSSYVVLVVGEESFARLQDGGSEAGCLPKL